MNSWLPVMRAADVKASDVASVQAGLPFLTLMEAAGRSVAQAVHDLHGGTGSVVVLTGGGANGGDGLVAARWLRLLGWRVSVLEAERARGPAEVMRDQAIAVGAPIGAATPQALRAAGADIILDALYGVGFHLPLSPAHAAMIAAVNETRPRTRVISVDLPSGLAADAVAPVGEHVRADDTIALCALKPAHLFGAARAACGRVWLAGAGQPDNVTWSHAAARVATLPGLAAWLPVRRRDAHKGLAGRVGILGGLARYPGAPALAALGAVHGGAGVVTVVSVPGGGLQAPVEAIRHEIPDWQAANLDFLRAKPFEAFAAGMGCGPLDPGALRALTQAPMPGVLDADALQPELYKQPLGGPRVFTPHPGEAARLLGVEVAAITGDPIDAAHQIGERFGVTVVLKGGPSVITAPGELPVVNPTGNPGMAAGGMGDVLAGLMAAIMAGKNATASGEVLGAFQAACLAVTLHGLAGDLLAAETGPLLSASALAGRLPAAWAALQAGRAIGPALAVDLRFTSRALRDA